MYFEEEYGFIKQSLKIEEKLFETKSEFQSIEVYKSAELGNIMALDGTAMMSQKDSASYHEMLAHVPICTHREPSRVLIIGGGDGGTAREALRHPDLQIDLVEIDAEVINAAKTYFPENGTVWENERVNLTVVDPAVFISEAEDKSYDIILVDACPDRAKNAELFDQAFFAQANRILKDDGMIALQGGSYTMDMEAHKSLLLRAGKPFGVAMPYRYEMLSYPGVNYNFILASKKYHPTADIILQRADLIEGLSYYNSDMQRAAFAVPTSVKKALLGVAKN